jgi:polyisoprenyl-phosphate glycosyltransferase
MSLGRGSKSQLTRGVAVNTQDILKIVPKGEALLPDTAFDEIAVIVPVYMGLRVVPELCRRLVCALETITTRFSIILVDDRSSDNPWPLICELGQTDERIRGVQLSRNFGQHHALTAGIDHARARWYVIMDCDLQDAPEDIPLLYLKAQEGFDMVVGVRRREGHGFFKRQSSRLFYAAFNLLAGFQMDWSVGNYRIFCDRVACSFRQLREQMPFIPASFSLMGFEVGSVALPHHSREAGRSSYTFMKLANLAANTILAHSQRPLKFAAALGLLIAALSLAAAVAIAARALFWGTAVVGWASLIVAVFIIGGMQIFVTGIVGIYVGKCFDEAKKRPLYFVRELSNL